MKLNIYMTVEGMEALALRKPVYSWHLTAIPLDPATGEETYGASGESIQLAREVEIDLPATSQCVESVSKKLQAKVQEIRANAHKEELEIQTRINDLLMVGYTPE